ncbi:fibronectin type III domain-containing protein [Marinobacter sp. G11]|uniref:fibronectin type III domain-containing protein n=1 Tax=Marinobacter sp. G11 TaxID=2903522 RepID=UPI001E629416|nr:fibronectin type III domain-containing protein [Marinobacter sp. G11]MCE0759261.1 fibronectin type III domain-containing protein [Marinobacter sp. G11]
MPNFLQKFPLYLIVVLFGVLLAGCGGGGSGDEVGDSQAGGSSVPSGQESAVGSESVSERKAVLSWTAPRSREDGSGLSLSELESYVIRYGQDKDNLTEQVVVPDAAAEDSQSYPSYTITGLKPGTWYFTVQAQDQAGLLSAPSEMVSKNISS